MSAVDVRNSTAIPYVRRHRKAATGLVRMLVVASATLAILLVCFSIYQYSQGRSELAAIQRTPPFPTAELDAMPATPQTNEVVPGVPLRPGVNVGPGRDIRLTLYRPRGTTAQLELAVADWTPVAGSSDEFVLTSPEIRTHTKDGNAVRVTAVRGTLEVEREAGGRLAPRRGRFAGGVVIEYDRLTESQRAVLPEASPGEPDAHLVRIELEEIEFDLEYARFIAPGRVRLVASDATLDVSDLEMRFNETLGRVERLTVRKGGRLELFGQSEEDEGLAAATLGANAGKRRTLVEWLRESLEAKLAAGTTVKSTEAPSVAHPGPVTINEDGVAVFRPTGTSDEKEPSPAPYYARFEGDIHATQSGRNATSARLEGDRLELIRDLAEQGGRGFAAGGTQSGDRPSGDPANNESADGNGGRPDGAPRSPWKDQFVLTWSDRLVIEPCDSEDERCNEIVRSKITITGSPARFSMPNGDATGSTIAFDPDGSKVWLRGGEGQPAVIRYANQGSLTGEDIFTERVDDRLLLRVSGRGRLTRVADTGSAEPATQTVAATATPDTSSTAPVAPEFANRLALSSALSDTESELSSARAQEELQEIGDRSTTTIEFADGLEATGMFVTQSSIDFTGYVTTDERRVLDEAVFRGDVQMRQRDLGLDADVVTLRFADPGRARRESQALQEVSGRGNVLLTQGNDRLRARDIHVFLTEDPSGRTVPREAVADGDVFARQGARTIQADNLIVDFERIRRPVVGAMEKADAQHAFVGVARDGATADDKVGPPTATWNESHDTTSVRAEGEVGVSRLRASGSVTVTDPAEKLEVRAERLDCSVGHERQLQRANVEGENDRPASVRLDPFTVVGERIQVDIEDESLSVPGAGRMTFRSAKDLDGRKVRDPIPIVVTWTNGMRYRGGESRAVFSGAVHAASQRTTTFDCDELMVEFDTVAKTEVAQNRTGDWWVLGRVIEPLLPNRSAHREGRRATERLAKEPAYILATGNAVALSSESDEQTGVLTSRARIAGPRLSVYLRPEVSRMLIEGPGTLLLEDYRPAKPMDRARGSLQAATEEPAALRPDRGLFAMEDDGPSNTLIEWSKEMWYDFGIEQTRFEGDVNLKHFSGAELLRVHPHVTADPETVVAPGRATFLTCDVLTADFLDADSGARSSGDRRMGRLRSDRLKQFQAAGAVVLQDHREGLSLTADRLVYWKDRSLLAIYASVQRKAHIVVQRAGRLPYQVSVEKGFYNLSSGEVELSKPSLAVR